MQKNSLVIGLPLQWGITQRSKTDSEFNSRIHKPWGWSGGADGVQHLAIGLHGPAPAEFTAQKRNANKLAGCKPVISNDNFEPA